MTLRADDEEIIAEIQAWSNRPFRDVQTGMVVLTQRAHVEAVEGRLHENGWRHVRRDELTNSHGDCLYVLTERVSRNAARGRRLERAWIHPDCHPLVWDNVRPCVEDPNGIR